MKRGPYKLYLKADGDGIMPRSTFYDKLKKIRCDAIDGGNQTTIQDAGDYGTHANALLPHNDNIPYENLFSIEATTETGTPLINQRASTTVQSEFHSWLYDEDYEESFNQEIWFDAEDLSSVENSNVNNSETNETFPEHTADDYYNKSLCPCTSITRGEVLMMTLLLGAQESLTWKTITSILSMINTIFGDNIIPSTKFKLFEALEFKDSKFCRHLYCNKCFSSLGVRSDENMEEYICQICKEKFSSSNVPFFLTLNFSNQLKQVMERPEVQQFLLSHKKHNGNDEEIIIRHITDGKTYKQLSNTGPKNFLHDKYNLTYTFNTDGCQAAKSSKLSIWPIYVSINELPAKLKSEFMMMVGVVNCAKL